MPSIAASTTTSMGASVPDSTIPMPAGFEDLASYADWCVSRDSDRIAKRLETPFAELAAFFDAVLPRVRDAMEYLATRPVDDPAVEDINLVNLLKMMTEAADAVEIYHQGPIPDAGDLRLYVSKIDRDITGSEIDA